MSRKLEAGTLMPGVVIAHSEGREFKVNYPFEIGVEPIISALEESSQ